MANTGFDWSAAWVGEFDGSLITGATIIDLSGAIDLDGCASCEVSIAATYNNYPKATGGLFVYILRTVNGTDYEVPPSTDSNSKPFGFEMEFSQDAYIRTVITISGADISKFQILLWWKNTTANSLVEVVTRYHKSSIPVAS